ncbi:MAG: UDP-2,3-diacylglucosamine hydrolase [Bacteroidetes bacterium]|nr:UDP-2,3-diacylglucosamine hydrolase [Bacteroidota bacterium]
MIKNKHYFISDTHLGIPNHEQSLEREKKLVRLLLEIKDDAKAIYLLGDIFDFWYEYKYVVPKGYVRLLGTLANLCDQGVEIHFFTGNHDQWLRDYFQTEIGMIVHTEHLEKEIDGKLFFIAHGDGFDEDDKNYNLLKSIFGNNILRVLFSNLHPYWAMLIAKKWSKHSRLSHSDIDHRNRGEDEPLIHFCKEKLKTDDIYFFILGHRHLATDYDLGNGRKYINIGEWVHESNYVVWDSETLELRKF